jgi:hypothetical protein
LKSTLALIGHYARLQEAVDGGRTKSVAANIQWALNALDHASQPKLSNLHLLLTSRPEVGYDADLAKRGVSVSLKGCVDGDITSYIDEIVWIRERKDEIRKGLLFNWIFPPLVQAELDGFHTYWSQHRVRGRPSRGVPSGHVPADVLGHPGLYQGNSKPSSMNCRTRSRKSTPFPRKSTSFGPRIATFWKIIRDLFRFRCRIMNMRECIVRGRGEQSFILITATDSILVKYLSCL